MYYTQQQSTSRHQNRQLHGDTLPSSITSLAAPFPFVTSLPSPESMSLNHLNAQPIALRTLTTCYLPSYSEALRLVQIYLDQAPWFFGAVTRRQIEEEMLPLWYEEATTSQQQIVSGPGAQSPANGPSPSIGSSSSPSVNPVPGQTHSHSKTGNSHDLALIFMIFCFGSLTDTNLPSPPDNIPAEKFFELTKVSLSLDPQAGAGQLFVCFF